jgi:hypothetical protein
MENSIIFPDDTLPSFDYLGSLSDVSENDSDIAINDWNQKYKSTNLENILEAEVLSE